MRELASLETNTLLLELISVRGREPQTGCMCDTLKCDSQDTKLKGAKMTAEFLALLKSILSDRGLLV